MSLEDFVVVLVLELVNTEGGEILNTLNLLGGDGWGFLSRSSLGGGSLSGGSLSWSNGFGFSTDLNCFSRGSLSGSGLSGGSLSRSSGFRLSNYSSNNRFNGESPESVRTGTVRSWGRVDGSWIVNNWGRSVNDGSRGGSWGVDNWSWGWGVSWSWGWGVNWSWGVCWSWGLVGGFLREVGLSLVFDISDVTALISVVGDNLDTAVGKVDTVFSGGVVVVAVLVVREGLSGQVIVDSVLEVVVGWEDGVGDECRWAVARGRGSVDLGHA
jgi:hypothetical protein